VHDFKLVVVGSFKLMVVGYIKLKVMGSFKLKVTEALQNSSKAKPVGGRNSLMVMGLRIMVIFVVKLKCVLRLEAFFLQVISYKDIQVMSSSA